MNKLKGECKECKEMARLKKVGGRVARRCGARRGRERHREGHEYVSTTGASKE